MVIDKMRFALIIGALMLSFGRIECSPGSATVLPPLVKKPSSFFMTQPDEMPPTEPQSRSSSIATEPHLISGYESIESLFKKKRFPAKLTPLERAPLTRLSDTRLHVAIKTNDFETTKILLQKDADPNSIDEAGTTPLELAVNNGDTRLVRLLLAFGANQNIKTQEGRSTLLHLAIEKGNRYNNFNEPMISVLLGLDLQLNPEMRRHNRVTIDLETVNSLNSIGDAPIHTAARRRLDGVMKMLLTAGADANIGTQPRSSLLVGGKKPLHLILEGPMHDEGEQEGALVIAQELFKYQADLNAADDAGTTPLQLAIDGLYVGIADFLLRNGAALGEYKIGEEPDQATDPARHLRYTMMSNLLRGWAEREIIERGETQPDSYLSLEKLRQRARRGLPPLRNTPPAQ